MALSPRTGAQDFGIPDANAKDGLSPRAFLIGLGLCALLGIWLTYNRMVVQGPFMGWYFLDRGVLFLFFCLAVLLNPLLGLLKRRYALGRGELMAIYAMLLLLMPAWAMTKALLGFMTGVTYYASPEMRHLEAVLPYSLPWLAVLDAEPVRWLYEGLPKGGSVPWWAWVVPLWSWGSFLVALFVVLGCVAVILRKQWEEHERFAFPIMQVPLAMGERGDGWIGPLFRGRMMWSGFAIPFAIGSMNALHSYYHTLPRISLRAVIWIFRRAIPMSIRLNFALLGYAYFVNLDVSLSIWLLNVIAKCINGVSAMLGAERYGVSGMVGRHSSQGSEFLAFMGMGYMLALAGYSLWIARGHLKAVWTKVLGRPSRLVDSEEVLPYRTAVACVLMGTLYLGCWLYQAGLPPHVIALLFIASFVVFLVLARIVSETGYAATYSPLNPSEFVVCAVGSSAFGPTGLVTAGVGYVWSMTRLNTLMPRASAALRLAREMGRTQGLIWAMGAALAVGLVVASHTTLDLGYAHGGRNLDYWFRDVNDAALPFDEYVGRRLLDPSPVFYRGFVYTGLGLGLAALLMVLRTRLSWWPIHPIALPVSTIWMTEHYYFSIFLAWGIKALVMKFGGATLYRKTRPFFIGIILGEAVCLGTWSLIDFATGKVGNMFLL
ncbi:MAG: hypothetical protein OXR72_21155 [Gemmatimonadota bacterium]|nr:hypothetical protein [Gemmatimonadota bacterium]